MACRLDKPRDAKDSKFRDAKDSKFSYILIQSKWMTCPTLEIRSGVTAVVDFLLGGGEIRSTNNSGSGKSALLFCDFGADFRPADFGFAHVS